MFTGTQQNLIQCILDASAPKRDQWKEIVDNAYRQEGMYGGTWTRTGDNGSSVGFVCESVIDLVSVLMYLQSLRLLCLCLLLWLLFCCSNYVKQQFSIPLFEGLCT